VLLSGFPGLAHPAVAGHEGKLVFGNLGGAPVVVMKVGCRGKEA
jgi:hypothetical protein